MIRRRWFIFVLLSIASLCVGCLEPSPDTDDPEIDFVLTDIIGTWNFPVQSGDSAITVEIFTSPTTGVFIKWTDDTYAYDCHGHGTLEGKVFSYTYGYTSTIDGSTGPASEVVLTLYITFSYRDNRLKVICSGEGPLDGKVFVTGEL